MKTPDASKESLKTFAGINRLPLKKIIP